MSNKFYAPGAGRAAKVQQLFGAIASRYDLVNDVQSLGMHRLWKRRLLRLANAKPGQTVLDLCCGTGDIALAFARAGCDTTGLDFSPEMLSVADGRAKQFESKGGTGKLRFLLGDALHLPFAEESFDTVTIGYGLRNLADLSQGLREMRRVTRKGGRVLVLDFGKPDSPAICGLYYFYLRRCVPLLGKIFCGDADTHAYILPSLQNYAAQRGVDLEMRNLGFTETKVINLLFGAMSINYGVRSG